MNDQFNIKISVYPATDDLPSHIEVLSITKLDPPKPKKPPKARDMSPITQEMFKIVWNGYIELRNKNMIRSPNNKISTQDLTDALNAKFGTDKSVTTFQKIWNGEVDVNKLMTNAELALNNLQGLDNTCETSKPLLITAPLTN